MSGSALLGVVTVDIVYPGIWNGVGLLLLFLLTQFSLSGRPDQRGGHSCVHTDWGSAEAQDSLSMPRHVPLFCHWLYFCFFVLGGAWVAFFPRQAEGSLFSPGVGCRNLQIFSRLVSVERVVQI